jgi:hypothetical protein
MAGVHSLAILAAVSPDFSLGDGLPLLRADVNPALYELSCDYACVQALLSRVSSHLVSDKKSDA